MQEASEQEEAASRAVDSQHESSCSPGGRQTQSVWKYVGKNLPPTRGRTRFSPTKIGSGTRGASPASAGSDCCASWDDGFCLRCCKGNDALDGAPVPPPRLRITFACLGTGCAAWEVQLPLPTMAPPSAHASARESFGQEILESLSNCAAAALRLATSAPFNGTGVDTVVTGILDMMS